MRKNTHGLLPALVVAMMFLSLTLMSGTNVGAQDTSENQITETPPPTEVVEQQETIQEEATEEVVPTDIPTEIVTEVIPTEVVTEVISTDVPTEVPTQVTEEATTSPTEIVTETTVVTPTTDILINTSSNDEETPAPSLGSVATGCDYYDWPIIGYVQGVVTHDVLYDSVLYPNWPDDIGLDGSTVSIQVMQGKVKATIILKVNGTTVSETPFDLAGDDCYATETPSVTPTITPDPGTPSVTPVDNGRCDGQEFAVVMDSLTTYTVSPTGAATAVTSTSFVVPYVNHVAQRVRVEFARDHVIILAGFWGPYNQPEACNGTPTGTPTDTPTETSTVTPTESATGTPTETPTDIPTGTATVTPSSTPSVTAEPSASPSPEPTLGPAPTQPTDGGGTPPKPHHPNVVRPCHIQDPTSTATAIVTPVPDSGVQITTIANTGSGDTAWSNDFMRNLGLALAAAVAATAYVIRPRRFNSPRTQ